MKKLAEPKQGGVLPIFYAGTLEEKYAELIKIQEKINRISANKDTVPSRSLLDERGELELEISRHLTNGERIGDDFIDYCLRHFHGGTTCMINEKEVRSPSVFDIIPAVKDFADYIKKARGQKILSSYEDTPNEIGVIHGSCEFKVKDDFRSLYVPTSQLSVFDEDKKTWKKGRSSYDPAKNKKIFEHKLFYVDRDLFSHPGMTIASEDGRGWSTDHSKLSYIGGRGPRKETHIYVGNELVARILGNVGNLVIPANLRK